MRDGPQWKKADHKKWGSHPVSERVRERMRERKGKKER